MKNFIIALGIVTLSLGGIVLVMYISLNNKEKRGRNLTEAQQNVCQANFDKMHKVIVQTAQVPERFIEQSKEAFKEIYPQLMEGRYSNERGGALMSWVSEHNPNFDMAAVGKMYERLQVVIEANRNEYFNEQEKLISYRNNHKNLIETWPGSMFIKKERRVPVEITVITSTFTEDVYRTGKEDDIDLFD
jgi:hypothetical protein